MADWGLPPEIEHLLQSNDPPSDVQVRIIEDSLAVARQRVIALNNLLDGPLATVAQTEQVHERDALLDSINCHAAILSVVRRIPTEILCDILALTLPHGRDVFSAGALITVPTPPWHLGWISRSWRDCAIGYGPLWASIHVETHKTETDQSVSHAALETQLHRSGNSDLEVTFTWGVQTPHLRALTDVVVVHSTRWASLTLHWTDGTDTDLIRSLLPISGRLLNLRHLELPGRPSLADLPEDLRQLFVTAPQLRKVFLTNKHYNYISPTFFMPWAQLTHLRVVYGTHSYAYDSLSAATNLAELGIEFDEDEENTWPLSTRPIVLPHLRRLRVYESWILGFIEAPRLEYLFLYDGFDEVLPFLRRSGCQLLGLGTTSMAMESLPILRALPHLLHLHHFSFIGGEVQNFLAALTLSGEPTDIGPHLISLQLSNCSREAGDHDALYVMAASRPTLVFLQIYTSYDIPRDQLTKLDGLREAGLDLRISHAGDLNERYPDMIPP
ncbi:hypothetical protein C8R43DRAFT_638831 [Mycena crocata]|nr:hypothetical protein C8R43DRAFT_638831 [Mycena crocata]